MLKKVIPFLLMVGMAHAGDCYYARVTAIQAQSTNVLVNVDDGSGNAPWKNLGTYSEEKTKAYQALLQQAFATGNGVMLRFPEGHSCSETDFYTSPSAVRLK